MGKRLTLHERIDSAVVTSVFFVAAFLSIIWGLASALRGSIRRLMLKRLSDRVLFLWKAVSWRSSSRDDVIWELARRRTDEPFIEFVEGLIESSDEELQKTAVRILIQRELPDSRKLLYWVAVGEHDAEEARICAVRHLRSSLRMINFYRSDLKRIIRESRSAPEDLEIAHRLLSKLPESQSDKMDYNSGWTPDTEDKTPRDYTQDGGDYPGSTYYR